MSKYEKFAIALTGCRTTVHGLDCCEYDFIVLSDENVHELLQADDMYAEMHAISSKPDPYKIAPLLQNMQIINDPSMALASLKQDTETVMSKAFSLYARNKAIDALFYANRSREVANENVQLSSLWLKCAAYYYLEAVIARNGSKPMPAHMLAQLRSISENIESEGITVASTCLGLERANRSSVSRCMEAVIGLNENIAKDHSTKIVSKKIQFLFQSGMYTDCYFYGGYIARNTAVRVASDQVAMKNYMFMMNIAMDLTLDQSFVFKLSKDLVDLCNALLLR